MEVMTKEEIIELINKSFSKYTGVNEAIDDAAFYLEYAFKVEAKHHSELAFVAGFESGEYEGEQVVKYLSDPNEGLIESKEAYIQKTFPE